jgi:pilus assembly protein CpaC
MDKADHQGTNWFEHNLKLKVTFLKSVFILTFFLIAISNRAFSQNAPPPAVTPPGAPIISPEPPSEAVADGEEKPEVIEELEEGGGQPVKILRGEPNQRRIKRQLNLVAGVKLDEEFLIPNVPLNYKGAIDFADIQRIKGTDIFRILPTKEGNGIITIHNKKTGQILVEVHVDIRNQEIEKSLREIKAMLADIDGIEFKIVNGIILLDGFVLLPKDLIRIANVIKQSELDTKVGGKVKNLVTLSPVARKKIIEYISREVNNPEVTVSAVGDFVKLEGVVNNEEEKKRIVEIVNMYLPDIVMEQAAADVISNVKISGRRNGDLIINLITIRPAEERVEPPPKMIQVVVHFVEFSDRYLKKFNFIFSPSLIGIGQAASTPRAPTSIGEIASIINNLLPKINWARSHGFIRVLDTASVLTQNTVTASINRSFTFANNGQLSVSGGAQTGGQTPGNLGRLSVTVKPTIKSERTGLIELSLNVNTNPLSTSSISSDTTISTIISVRDRASAAFGGIISKKSTNDYGGPSDVSNAIITLNHGKSHEKGSSNFVVFVTPVIKSSASAGVEQVKKKFRMKDTN